ncbi:MAG: hypothetical protein QXD60_03510 [Nanopusillaceae archaeon]
MEREAIYMTALKVRPERLENLRRILALREKHAQVGREAFAALLKQELPHLAEAFTPEGVNVFLSNHEPRLDERGFLHLGAVRSGGTKEEAILLSCFLKPEEVLVLSIRLLNPEEAAAFSGEELFYGYRIVKERWVERLRAALVDGEDRLVWKKETEAAEFWVRFEQGDYTTDLVTTVVWVGDSKGELLLEITYEKPIPYTETITRLLSEPPASWNEERLEAAKRRALKAVRDGRFV